MPEEYNKVKMRKDLLKLGKDLKGYEVAQIAGLEECATQTVYTYLKAENLPCLALAAAIVQRGAELIKQRKAD